MTRIVILNGAELDFREISGNFKAHHTAAAHAAFKSAFKTLFADLKQFPDSGTPVPEATAVGLLIRQRVCEQGRVVYQHELSDQTIYIRMFLPTQRNFIEHLTQRILRPTF